MKSTDYSVKKIIELGYVIQNVSQVHKTCWDVTIRNPADWYNLHYEGISLAGAFDAARKDLIDRGPAKNILKHKKQRVRLKRDRVRLSKKRKIFFKD